MKQPTEDNFTVQNNGSNVIVMFQPTESYYTFSMLGQNEWAKHGKLSKDAKVRHASSGDTDQYNEQEVFNMAYQLAEKSI